jgi:hypothetical protein
MLLPFSAMAMTPIADSELAAVSGQASVMINLDLAMDLNIDVVSWTDTSGVAAYMDTAVGIAAGAFYGWNQDEGTFTFGPIRYSAPGSVGLTDLAITGLRINARSDSYTTWFASSGPRPFQRSVGDEGYDLQFMKINVGTANSTSALATNVKPTTCAAGTSFVRIELGTLHVAMASMSAGVELGSAKDLSYGTGTVQELGDIWMSGFDLYMAPDSFLDIFNDRGVGTQGVSMNLQVKIDRIDITDVSWSDTDGAVSAYFSTGTPAQGYVGLHNMIVQGLGISCNQFNIDVGTPTGGVYYGSYKLFTGAAFTPYSLSYVHFGFGADMNITMVSFDADAFVGASEGYNAAGAASGDALFGHMYVGGMNLKIKAGSWIDLCAF